MSDDEIMLIWKFVKRKDMVMLTYYEKVSLSAAYQLLGELYDPFVLEEGVNSKFAPDELKEEMENFQEIQDAYFEYKIEKRLRKFKTAIHQMKLATKELIQTFENEEIASWL